MTTQYAIASLLWAAGGFLAGIAVCHRQYEGDPSVDDEAENPRPRWRRHLNSQAVIGLLMLAVVAGSVGMMASQAAANRHQAVELKEQAGRLAATSACQREYNEAFKAGLRTRSEAGKRDRMALRNMVVAILDQPGSREAGRSALREYIRESDAADQERDDAPLPTRDCDPDNTRSRPGG